MSILAVLLIAEGITRWAAAGGYLPSPEPLLWHRLEVDTKLHQIQSLEANRGIDVLFAGSSLAYTGVNPVTFDQHYESLTGFQVVSYNAGLAALSTAMNSGFIERVFLKYASPHIIILILSPRDMNINNPITRQVDQEVLASDYGQLYLGTGFRSDWTRILLENSQLFRYRNVITLSILNGFRFPNELPVNYDNPDFDQRGYVSVFSNFANKLAAGDPDPNHWAAISLQSFDASGNNQDGLEGLIRFCVSRDMTLVLVNMPVTEFQAASFGNPDADYDQYLDVLTDLSQMGNVAFWDLNRAPYRDRFDEQDFSDVFHLNAQGAQKLSMLLAELLIAGVEK